MRAQIIVILAKPFLLQILSIWQSTYGEQVLICIRLPITTKFSNVFPCRTLLARLIELLSFCLFFDLPEGLSGDAIFAFPLACGNELQIKNTTF